MTEAGGEKIKRNTPPRRRMGLASFDNHIAADFRAGVLEAFNPPIQFAKDEVLIAGVDEAGRGPLAGPVVAAAVVLPPGLILRGIDDSKQLSEEEREALYPRILERALSVGVGVVEAEVIDTINILQATKLAASMALKQLTVSPDLILLDYLKLENEARPQLAIIQGDAQSQSIAAASVVAKVTRDRMMVRYNDEYPEYGFASHKGYGVPFHQQVLNQIGPSTLHRLTFAGVCFFDQSCRHSLTFQKYAPRVRSLFTDGRRDEALLCLSEIESVVPRREYDLLRAFHIE